MTKGFIAQMQWFVWKLIELRLQTEGFHTPVIFDSAEIRRFQNPAFNLAQRKAQEHVIFMLSEVRGSIASMGGISNGQKLVYRSLPTGQLEISGYTTASLRKYLQQAFGVCPSLLGEAQDIRGKAILTYMEKPTAVPISGAVAAMFRCLYKEYGKTVPYEVLFEVLKRSKGPTAKQIEFSHRYNTPVAQRTVVQSAIGNLIKKLNEVVPQEQNNELIKNNRDNGYTMVI